MPPAISPSESRAQPLNSPPPPPPPVNPPSLPLLPVFILFFVLFCFLSIFLFRDLINYLSTSRQPGRVPPPVRAKAGVDPATVASFPTISYEEAWRLTEGKCGGECPVCLSEFAAGDVVRLLTVCSHAFHPGCIDSWLVSHRTCPMCRSNLEASPVQAAAAPVRESGAGGGSYAISIEEEGREAHRNSRVSGQSPEGEGTR